MDKDSHLKDTIRNQEKELEISGCEELKAAADAYAGEDVYKRQDSRRWKETESRMAGTGSIFPTIKTII